VNALLVHHPSSIFCLADVIIPNLVWRAGRTAEAIRTAAISCLYATFQHSADSVSPFTVSDTLATVLEPLIPLLLTLVEDFSKKTRLITCRTLGRLMRLLRITCLHSADLVHQIYPGMLLSSLYQTRTDSLMCSLLGCDTMYYCVWAPTFQRHIILEFSVLKWVEYRKGYLGGSHSEPCKGPQADNTVFTPMGTLVCACKTSSCHNTECTQLWFFDQ